MKIKISKSQWEKMGKQAGWMKKAQIDPAAGTGLEGGIPMAGGGYKNPNMNPVDKTNDDDKHRRRTVKVTFNDGEVMTTEINGTKRYIEDYYKKNEFVKQDETTMHHGVKVEFLE